jgi:VanZ family protein
VASYVSAVFIVVACVAIYVAATASRRVRPPQRRASLEAIAPDVALCASVAAILVLTLTPLHHRITGGAHELQLRPLADMIEGFRVGDRRLLLEEASNILLFLPLGGALRLRGYPIRKAALIGLLLSGTVEVVQLLFVPGRTTSVDDLLLNVVGTVLGYGLLSPWVPARGVAAHWRANTP